MKDLKFFKYPIVDVGINDGWTEGNRFEAQLGSSGTRHALRFTINRHDDGKNWTATLSQATPGGVAIQLEGDDFEKLVARCEDRVRELCTQLGMLTAPKQ